MHNKSEYNVRCCASCNNLVPIPRNNSYDDIDYLCICNGYYCSSIYKDRAKIKSLSPGGKELICHWTPNIKNYAAAVH